MNRKQFFLYLSTFTVTCGIFMYLIYIHSLEISAFVFFGGPVGNYYNPIEIIWWLIIFTPVWAACGGIIAIETTIAKFRLYRLVYIRTWWFDLVLKVLVINLWYFVLLIVVTSLQNIELINVSYLKIFFLLILHSFSMVVTMIWLFIITRQINFTFMVLIVVEALAKLPLILGLDPIWVPFVWGMAGYSNILEYNGGFSYNLVVIIQIVYCLLLYFLPFYFRTLIFRGANL